MDALAIQKAWSILAALSLIPFGLLAFIVVMRRQIRSAWDHSVWARWVELVEPDGYFESTYGRVQGTLELLPGPRLANITEAR